MKAAEGKKLRAPRHKECYKDIEDPRPRPWQLEQSLPLHWTNEPKSNSCTAPHFVYHG